MTVRIDHMSTEVIAEPEPPAETDRGDDAGRGESWCAPRRRHRIEARTRAEDFDD